MNDGLLNAYVGSDNAAYAKEQTCSPRGRKRHSSEDETADTFSTTIRSHEVNGKGACVSRADNYTCEMATTPASVSGQASNGMNSDQTPRKFTIVEPAVHGGADGALGSEGVANHLPVFDNNSGNINAPANGSPWQFSFMRNVTSVAPKSALCRTDFEPNPLIFDFVRNNIKILIIGAGGLGCELLKNLALNGFTQLHIIDMDTIDLSNLNRQFLFNDSDIGKSKAEVAARHIQAKVPAANVKAYFNRIEDFDADFYRQFHIVVSGLDSIVARRWINSLLVSLLRYDDATGALRPETAIILIDGGTEGFKGNARVITPGMSACFECTLGFFPPQANFPLCTIAHTPRLPEHCLEYVRIIQWPKDEPFGADISIDGDDPNHVEWVRGEAVKRAQHYGIPTPSITFQLAQGVLKRIIPAVASTNAVIAAACATEVFKVATSVYKAVDNQFLFNQTDGVYTHTYQADRLDDCMACSRRSQILRGFSYERSTLRDIIEHLQSDTGQYQMRAPSLFMTSEATGRQITLYISSVKSLEEQTRSNLDKTLKDLGCAQTGQELSVQDVSLAAPCTFLLDFSEQTATTLIET